MTIFNTPQENIQPENKAPLSPKEQESNAMGDLLANMLRSELPDAIDIVMLGPSSAEQDAPGLGFACFAARLFADVGASRIRSIAAAHDMDIIRLTNTGTFWARFPYNELSDDELSSVLAAEAAMNRLLFVKEAFDQQSSAQTWTEADCALADASLIATIAASAPEHIKGTSANPLLEIYGTHGTKGGEWDIRTRFALVAESLRLPYRLAYNFDCNAAEGLFSIDYTAPLAAWMPQKRFDVASGMWVDCSAQASQDAARYALSVGAMLASAAFGTSVGISSVRIASHP